MAARVGSRTLVFAVVVALVATVVTAGLVAASSASPKAGGGGGSGGCPSSNALPNFSNDTNVTASFVVSAGGDLATYYLSSANESSSGGVPGLISYCVYPSGGMLPNATTAVAVGANAALFTVSTGSAQGYFAYQRATGNPSNLPFDGSSNVELGNASWTMGAPMTQTILLHINDPYVCNLLYGSNPGTCFVIPSTPGGTCSSPGVAPASIRVSLPTPSTTVPSGATLSVAYEVAVVNYSSGDLGATIHVPTVKGMLPLSGSGNWSLTIAPHMITVAGAGWSSPVQRTVMLASATSFSTLTSGWLTSSNLAVMVAGGNPGVQLEVRWGWTVNVSGTLTQSWSTPSFTAKHPDQPSEFMAAPFVSISSSSGTTVTTGSYYWLDLSGAVGNTTFRTLVENTNGKEFHCQAQTNHASGSGFEVGVPLTYGSNYSALVPGSYLIHVHDQMGAIVLQISIVVKP